MKVYINRMRVIASACQLIRPQGGKPVVKWTSNGELNCPAKALFSLPRDIRVMDVTGGDNSNPPPQTSPRRGGWFLGLPDFQLAVCRIHGNGLTRENIAPKQTLGEHGFHGMLDIPA